MFKSQVITYNLKLLIHSIFVVSVNGKIWILNIYLAKKINKYSQRLKLSNAREHFSCVVRYSYLKVFVFIKKKTIEEKIIEEKIKTVCYYLKNFI